jgi:hypothetical protein
VKWFRAAAPDFVWKEHEMRMMTDGVYIDSQVVPIPTPPTPTGNGLFDNKWNRVADEKHVPWLLPSKYHVRYVHQNYVGEWSPYTEEYVSDQYTAPSLKAEPLVDEPTANLFKIEWEACGSYIILPLSENSQTFRMTFDDVNHFELSTQFGPIGSDDYLLMPLATFVDTWNSFNMADPWPMNLLPDGRLQIMVVDGSGVPGSDFWLFEATDPSYNQWWSLMGFDQFGVWQLEEPITANESVAALGCVSRFGVELVDGI